MEARSRIAFGRRPNKSHNFRVSELSEKQMFVAAYNTAKSLKWNIGYMSETGFIAYTGFSWASMGEKVEVIIGAGNITIRSECNSGQIIDWGKNIKNIEEFITVFNRNKASISQAEAEAMYGGLSKDAQEPLEAAEVPRENGGKLKSFLSMFIPVKGYYVTPVLVLLNILMFMLMIISGVHMMEPSVDSLILWGANLRPLTIDGEWWRLISSTFIHIGLLHLLMNMYALIYIGQLLEPYLGRIRFTSAYLLTGIAASVTSLYWHEFTVSAGASGAIFGMYGIFLALLTTNLIEKNERISLLISIGIFVMYNIVNGFRDGGIDNAAHIGGLISGLVVGYSFYPGLVRNDGRSKALAIGALTLVIALGSFAVMSNTSSDYSKYQRDMEQFAKLEESALRVYSLGESASEQQLVDELHHNGIKKWHDCISILDKVDGYNIPENLKQRAGKVKTYCELRIKTYELLEKRIIEKTDIYDGQIDGYSRQIEKVITELGAE